MCSTNYETFKKLQADVVIRNMEADYWKVKCQTDIYCLKMGQKPIDLLYISLNFFKSTLKLKLKV